MKTKPCNFCNQESFHFSDCPNFIPHQEDKERVAKTNHPWSHSIRGYKEWRVKLKEGKENKIAVK